MPAGRLTRRPARAQEQAEHTGAAEHAVQHEEPQEGSHHSGLAQDVRGAARQASANVPTRARGKARRGRGRLELFSNLPDYLRDNEFILGSYRREQSMVQSLTTLFNVHNETGNVWTHLLGFLLFVGLAIYVGMYHRPAPLALTPDHIDGLWSSVQGRFSHLQGSLGSGLATLQDSISGNLHTIQGSLGAGLHTIHESLSDNLEALEGKMQQGVAALQDNLHTLGDELTSLGSGLKHSVLNGAEGLGDSLPSLGIAAALRLQVQQQLKPLLQWPTHRWPVYVYFAGAMTCLLTSTVCHLLACCAQHVSSLAWRFDYTGIAVLIVTSFVPAIYYAFLCQPFWRHFYIATTAVMGVVVACVSLLPVFQSRKYRVLRACIFSGLGLWGIVPLLHIISAHYHVWAIREAFKLDIAMGVLYLTGAALFATRIPERWVPGKVDLAGHSHQLFHIAVVIAAYLHYQAIMILLEWRDASGGCAAPVTSGPVKGVMAEMAARGMQPMGIEAVWQSLSQQLHNHLLGVAAS